MVAVFGWLDSSEHDRRRALDVIDLFRNKETVDELGLGSIRDTIADVLAPGTSTIQTRARYFFFVPWVYQALERQAKNAGQIGTKARQREVTLIEELRAAPDSQGTIGIDAGAGLRRLPSAVYWAGLGRLQFRLFLGSQDQYHRVIERGEPTVTRDDSGDLGVDVVLSGHWHPHLPEAPAGFPNGANFALSVAEAIFFREQLRLHAHDSLFSFLVEQGQPPGDLSFPWQHPDIVQMPASLRTWLVDGQTFSELMHGAQLLYNLLLAQARKSADLIETYRDRLAQWSVQTDQHRGRYSAWDRGAFWGRISVANPRLPPGARRFAEHWIRLVLEASAASTLIENQPARALLALREQQLKGPRARLQSPAHLALWGGASGTQQLTYRWDITERLVTDIVAGLGS